jgi:hypothetical protein
LVGRLTVALYRLTQVSVRHSLRTPPKVLPWAPAGHARGKLVWCGANGLAPQRSVAAAGSYMVHMHGVYAHLGLAHCVYARKVVPVICCDVGVQHCCYL